MSRLRWWEQLRLLDKIPDFYSECNLMKAIYRVNSTELDNVQARLSNVLDQFFIDTISTSIDRWEKEVEIPKNELSIEQRREQVKSKLRGYGTVTLEHLKNVCASYGNGEVEIIENPSIYEFIIKFVGEKGIPQNIENLKKIVDDLKPAHLGVVYEFSYLTWDETDTNSWTWNETDALNLTWDQFEVYGKE
jgi:hypothetical protein